ncbi:MAG: GTPase Era [Kordiimonas sp.]|nr:GTPase Era [Kordiimonas sp.]|tara:strand:+ start:3703 stop:4605 length:903 start_codon:yes stop_codon:yes gene_type:complete
MTQKEMRCGFIALVGAPNAGKSTLLNAMVGAKLSIVTHKVQTTRSRVIGVITENENQLVFVDTPGIFRPKRRLDRAMVSAAWGGAVDADEVVLLVDATRDIDSDTRDIIKTLKDQGRQVILALNKIDKVKRDTLLALSQTLYNEGVFKEVFMISALKEDGLDALKNYLCQQIPSGHWLYPEDQMTDITERLLAAEITREKAYLRLHEELPYALTVETEKWQDRKDGAVRIEQVIYVQRDTQKRIVIGKQGQSLKIIGQMAREEMEQSFGRKVHLFLFVKVRQNWIDDRERYQEIGLDYVD